MKALVWWGSAGAVAVAAMVLSNTWGGGGRQPQRTQV